MRFQFKLQKMQHSNSLKKILFFYSLIGLALFLIINISIIRLEPNPITLNHSLPISRTINDILPQGWAFFTKDVNEGYYKIFKVIDVKLNKLEKTNIKSSSSSQLMGIIRENRSISTKILFISDNVDKNLWHTTNKKIKDISLTKLSVISIKVKEPMIYGKYLICKGKPMPYEWYKSKLSIQQTINYLILEFKK